MPHAKFLLLVFLKEHKLVTCKSFIFSRNCSNSTLALGSAWFAFNFCMDSKKDIHNIIKRLHCTKLVTSVMSSMPCWAMFVDSRKNRTDNTWVAPLWQTATPPTCSNLGFLPEPRIELFDRRKSSTAFCFFSVGSALLYLLVLMLSEWKGWPCLPSLKYKKLPRDK